MEIIRDLLIFIGAMFALCIVLIVVVSKLPDQNPLKRLLTALTYRERARRSSHAQVPTFHFATSRSFLDCGNPLDSAADCPNAW